MTEERRAIEAILMVAEEPIEPQLLAQLLEISVARDEPRDVLPDLVAEFGT